MVVWRDAWEWGVEKQVLTQVKINRSEASKVSWWWCSLQLLLKSWRQEV